MRVSCNRCGATYNIDDKLIPPQGARAQCPKCRALQVVKREGAPLTVAEAVRPVAPQGAATPQPARPAPAAAPPPRPEPAPSSGPVVSCRSCKKPLSDNFDVALGVCEDCRAKEHAAEHQSGPVVSQSDPFAGPVPDFAANMPRRPAADPFAGLPNTAPAPAPVASPEPAPPRRAGSRPDREKVAAAAAAAMAASQPRGVSAARPGASRSRAGLVAVLAVLVLGGAAGYVALTKPAVLFAPKKVEPKILPAIARRLMGWKLAAVGLQGTSQEHFEKGRELYLRDAQASYAAAEEEFKAAVILNPGNLKAAALAVEALAVGKGERASPETLADARELLDAILEAEPKLGLAHRARANLLLATDQADLARPECEKAQELSAEPEQAEVLLALGRTYLKKSAPVARQQFDAALQKAPSLKRALYYRGLAAEYAGHLAPAIADYEARLKLDPDQRETLRAEARVQALLGDYQAARKALARYASRHPDAGEPRILIAQLAYGAERDLKDADKLVKGQKADFEKFDDLDKAQYLSLLAALARERGDAKGAAEQLEHALKLIPGYPPAHFQGLLVALTAGDNDKARKHLEGCETKIGDPARAAEYQGRVNAAGGLLDAAISGFRRASELSPGRIGPRLWTVSLLLKKGDEATAWATLRQALDLDPSALARQRVPVNDFYELPADAIKPLTKGAPATIDESNWMRGVFGAMVDYHAGESDRAQRALDKSLVADPTLLASLIYRAQIELDRKRFDSALSFAKRAKDADRDSAVAHYLAGRALEGLKRTEEARLSYIQASQLAPGFAPAQLRLGMLAAARGDKAEAGQMLDRAVADDPDNLEARAALFSLGN